MRYFQFNEGSQGWRCLRISVPMDQIPCKTIGISNLHCALHTHTLTNAKSIVTFEIGIIPWQKYTFFKGKFCEEFKYATNFLLDGKFKIENDEILTYIKIKKNNDIQHSVPLYSKTIVHYKFPCFESPYCSEHI